MKKVCSKAKVNLDKNFLPKRKRVLNKCTLKVLNGKSKKKIKVAQPQPLEDDVTHDLLDSQSSIGACFLESQSRSQVDGPASPLASRVPFSQSQSRSQVDGPASPLASHVPLSQSQSRSQVDGPASPLASHVPFSQSQTESVSSPVQQAAQHPSECHACLFMHAAYTYTCTYVILVFHICHYVCHACLSLLLFTNTCRIHICN